MNDTMHSTATHDISSPPRGLFESHSHLLTPCVIGVLSTCRPYVTSALSVGCLWVVHVLCMHCACGSGMKGIGNSQELQAGHCSFSGDIRASGVLVGSASAGSAGAKC